ncbi:uncharacterized protein ACNS7B_002035 isoform 2-T2 [Menidia menidia]
MSVLSAAQRWTSQIPLSGVACWTCGGTRAGAGYEPPDRDPNRQTASSKRKPKPGRECPLTEVVQVIRVVGPPAPFPGPGGTYSVPVTSFMGIICILLRANHSVAPRFSFNEPRVRGG